MHRLICFPHYTCGGLLCDIFNQVTSPLDPRGLVLSDHHEAGKIGDSDQIYDVYDPEALYDRLRPYPDDVWLGTHCWPGLLDADRFSSIIAITTHTQRSRVYRWARAFHHYFQHRPDWIELDHMARVDKSRETAKNYHVPFAPVKHRSNIVNIEFSDVVDITPRFLQLVQDLDWQADLDRWRAANNFLYSLDFWHSDPVQYYHHADYELGHGTAFVYHV